jgi:hypothetical protein
VIQKQFQPIKLTADLQLEVRRQSASVAGHEFVETFTPIAAQRLVARYSLREQQSLDPIDVLDPLGDQHPAFAAEPAAIFFLGRRRPDHHADPRFAALISQQRAQKRFAIDLVGFGAPSPARCRNRGRVDVLTFGDDEALALGVDAPRLPLFIVAGATLMTAACVSVAGIIGLVGLIAPHLARPFCGPSARLLIPVSAVLGGVFLLLVDDFSRVLSGAELPIGVLTSLIGAPIFLYLLSSIARKGWS